MIETRIATASAATPEIQALIFRPPSSTNSVTSGKSANSELAKSELLTGSMTCLYMRPSSRGTFHGVAYPCRPLHHLLQRHAVPGGRAGGGHPPRTPRVRGSLSAGADLLRADARQQRLPARGAAARPPLRARVRRRGADRLPVGLLRGDGPRAVSAAGPADRRPRPGPGDRGARAAGARGERAAGRRPRGRGRRRELPAPGDLPPDVPLAARHACRRPADPPAARGAGHRPRRAA